MRNGVKQCARFFQHLKPAKVSMIFPAVLIGLVLPLDFLYQIDGYRTYLNPLGIGALFTQAAILYSVLAFMMMLPLAILAGVVGKLTRGKAPGLSAAVFGAATRIALALALLKGLKLWLLQTRSTSSDFLQHSEWPIAGVAVGACLILSYRDLRRPPIRFLRATIAIASTVIAVALLIPLLDWALRSRDDNDHATTVSSNAATAGPSIVLLTIDSFNARYSSAYGFSKDTTPAIRQLVNEASIFTAFYANSNWTIPGVESLFFGVRPWTFLMNDGRNAKLSLPAELRLRGYNTLAVTTNYNASTPRHGLTRYFDDTAECALPLKTAVASPCGLLWIAPLDAASLGQLNLLTYWGRFYGSVSARSKFEPAGNHFDPEAALLQARQMLKKQPHTAPFFLWVHLTPPHAPYASPEPFLGRFDPTMKNRTRFDSEPAAMFAAKDDATFPEAYVGRYEESLQYVDHHVGKFLDWLKREQLFARSLIVLTADHGESFSRSYGQHGGPLLHEDLIHIPLIIKAPYQTQARRVDSIAEQVDILPTLLDYAGGVGNSTFREGLSLRRIVEERASLPDRPVFSVNADLNNRFHPLRRGTIAMIDGRWKYVRYRGYEPSASFSGLTDELYDLATDPYEQKNLVDQRVDKAAAMRNIIDSNWRMRGGL